MTIPGLDRWITGNYGEDQLRNEPQELDEGLEIVRSAMAYLKERADADADEQLIGDYDAYRVLSNCEDDIVKEYDCRFCGRFTGGRNSWCSRTCRIADEEGY